MGQLEQALIEIAKNAGASSVGFASSDRLKDAPPSARPEELLSSTRSVISVALPLDGPTQRDFLAKRDRLSHCHERKRLAQELYELGDHLVAHLRELGFEALSIDINNVYRSEPGARDVTEMTEFYPDFSHRYAAIAAGVGRLGWSGNLLTPEQGAMVELGTVLTSAELEASPRLEKTLCDECKVCAAACPVGMIESKRSISVTVAGLTEVIAQKRPNTCCWIGCTGYQGLSTNGRWSNWSPYRLDDTLPRDKNALDALCIALQKADPQMSHESNSLTDYRRAVFDPSWFFNTVCGHCRGVCWKDRRDRKDNLRSLRRSGVVAMTAEGIQVSPEKEIEVVKTPFGVNVAISRHSRHPKDATNPTSASERTMSPLDEAVFDWIFGGR